MVQRKNSSLPSNSPTVLQFRVQSTASVIAMLFIALLLAGCKNEPVVTEPWMKPKLKDWPQLLLTNTYHFDGSTFGAGASSFLVEAKGDTFLCTAGHLLGSDMGISPEVNIAEANSLLDYWAAFPRTDSLCSDTIQATRILNDTPSDYDILLMEIASKKHNIQPLRPRLDSLEEGTRLYIVGCEYADKTCHQWRYRATVDSYDDHYIFAHLRDKFEVAGFSGAPVLDVAGRVVGTVCYGTDYGADDYVGIEPLSVVRQYLE